MKASKAKELRTSSSEELQQTSRKLQDELFRNRLRKATNQLEDVSVIRTARREIARINTLLAEKLRAGSGAAKPAEEK